jgi:hypothetical protein
MKNLLYVSIIFAMLILVGCGKKNADLKTSADSLKTVTENISKPEDAKAAADVKIQERKRKGDTLAMSGEKLVVFLPDNVPGYTAHEPAKQSMQIQQFSWTMVERDFSKTDGEDEIHTRVQIMDYNQAYTMLYQQSAPWIANFSVDNESETAKSYNFGMSNTWGFERIDKHNKKAEVTLVVGWRFFIHIEADKQSNTDFVKSLLKTIKIEELSKM